LPVPEGKPASDEYRALAYEQSRSIREDILILQAMQQVYQEKEIPYQRQPDPAFLELVELIYAASHPGGSMIPPGLPHASLHLLRRYLEGRPVLQKSLRSAMHRGRGRTRWNPTLILQRVQRVATILMSYHGWGNCGALRVRAVTGDPNAHAGDVFGVHVEIAPFLWAQLQQPGPQAMGEIQIALAWVVWALFEYAHDLGLGATEYW
jgi:hypothetical protein